MQLHLSVALGDGLGAVKVIWKGHALAKHLEWYCFFPSNQVIFALFPSQLFFCHFEHIKIQQLKLLAISPLNVSDDFLGHCFNVF